jgi:segregation and condensation protein A
MSVVGNLELDLDVFAGPFDLLLSLVLREELDLLEVDLADIVLAYVDHLQQRGDLDLESTTEFRVLIAALLELKSRLMLPGEEMEDELDDLDPARAGEELLARMLAYARYRGASSWARERFELGHALLFRSAPLPPELRRVNEAAAGKVFEPELLGRAIGGLLRHPPALDLQHMRAPSVSLSDRLGVLRGLLRRGSFDFEEAVRGADRMTVCMTLYALLELYKRGEAGWEQDECFGEVRVRVPVPARSTAAAVS